MSDEAPPSNSPPPVPRWRDPATVATVGTVTQVLLAAAAGWYLMSQLAPILRPLLVAVFLAYVLMPYHSRLRNHIGSPASIGVLAATAGGTLAVLALVTYASILGLSDDLPQLQRRGAELAWEVERWVGAAPQNESPPSRVERLVGGPQNESQPSRMASEISRLTQALLATAADVIVEAAVVAMYLLFLLLEGSRFPDRVRRAYSSDRADEILQIAGQVNAAIVSYLRVKVRASLALAVPVGITLALLGVKFAPLWAVLTFLCNFIPYIGPIVALGTPVGFAFLWFGVAWQPVTATALLLALHIASAVVIEPTMIGKAVGLSPLVLLAALAFWGLLWGITGMFLAVPLTVVAVIVMGQFETTRPAAGLLCGG